MKYLLVKEQENEKVLSAENWLNDRNVQYEIRDICEVPLSEEEFRNIILKSGKKIKKFLNKKSSLFDKEEIQKRIKDMSLEEGVKLLLSNIDLIRFPILMCEEKVIIGFKEKKWEKNFDYIKEKSKEAYEIDEIDEKNENFFLDVVEDVRRVRKASVEGKSIKDISKEMKLDEDYVTCILMTAEGYAEDDDVAVAHLVILE